jgi:hypothetical protein
MCCVPILSTLILGYVHMVHDRTTSLLLGRGRINIGISLMFALVGSVSFDFLGIVALRTILLSISRSPSFRRVALGIAALVAVAVASELIPFYAARFKTIELMSYLITSLDLSTVFYCIIPAATLVFVLFHRLIWPILSRLLYPVASRKVITNRPALVSVGSLCFLYALTAQIGLKEALKLLS